MASGDNPGQDIYKPKHPLPVELQQMERDDTVCQFCGVSYLIHNEIKRLEEEIERYKEKLKKYHGCDEREDALKKKIEDKNEELNRINKNSKAQVIRIKDLEKKFEETNNLLIDAETEKGILNEKLLKRQSELDKTAKTTKDLYLSLSELLKEINSIKRYNEDLREGYSSFQNKMKIDLLNSSHSIKELSTNYEQENKKIMLQSIEARNQFEAASNELEALKANLSKANEEIHIGNEAKRNLKVIHRNIDDHKKEISKLKEERASMTDALNKMKAMLSERNKKLNSMESVMQEKDRCEKEAMVQHARSIEQCSLELEALNKRCRDYEQQIEAFKQTNKDEKEAMTSTAIQIKVLKESLDGSKNEISVLKKERQDMIEAHQNRIKQLRESFNEKMSEANSWPKKLEEKLTEQQLRFNEDKNELWQQLTSSFQKEIQELNLMHDKEKNHVLNREKDITTKLKDQLETLQRRSREEIENQKSNFAKEKERHAKITQSQESLVHNLEYKMKQLEMRLENTQKKSKDESGSYKQKYIETQKSLEGINTRFNVAQKKLDEKEKEINTLQDIVRRECEERFELTEALTETRLKLLSATQHTSQKQIMTSEKQAIPSLPLSSRERGRREFQRKLKQNDNPVSNSTQCNASKDQGITYTKMKQSLDESYNRKRISEAVAKQRASSRASFEKLS